MNKLVNKDKDILQKNLILDKEMSQWVTEHLPHKLDDLRSTVKDNQRPTIASDLHTYNVP